MVRNLRLAINSVLVATLVLVVFMSWKFPNFWQLFIVPWVSLSMFQTIALSKWKHKKFMFKCTDYIYYMLIGGVVAIGSQYLFKADTVTTFNTMLEIDRLKSRLEIIDMEIPRLREALKRAKIAYENIDEETFKSCFAKSLRESQFPKDKKRPPFEMKIDFCQYILDLIADKHLLPRRIESLERERSHVSVRLELVERKKVSLPHGGANLSAVGSRAELLNLSLELIWVPTILLVGITFKLGKTTCGFCS